MRTHCARGHQMTPENTVINPTDHYRRCRACQRMRKREARTYADRAEYTVARCVSCGHEREVTVRTMKRIESGELSGRCADCRYLVTPLLRPAPADYRGWWLERFTLRECAQLWQAVSLYLDLEPERKAA